MKTTIRCLSVLCLLTHASFAEEPQEERRQAAAALEILNAWHADQPQSGERFLHIVCWTPADREFSEDYQQRLTRIMKHIQVFYLREMERFGFTDRTIGLQLDAEQQLVLHTVRGKHPTEHYARGSGREIRGECLPTLQDAGVDAENETVLIMCNLADWDKTQLRFTHKSPYYAGGNARRGTAWQLDSPELDPRNLKLKQPRIHDGEYGRISLGKHNSIFIGGIAHELGHALGLPHCRARPDEAIRGTALMGSGNRSYGDEIRGEGRGSILTLAHALRLATHPQFSGSIKGLQQKTQATIDKLSIVADGKAIKVSGVVSGDPPVYAVVAYFDPDGGGDYNSTTATAVPLPDGRFTLQSSALKAASAGELRLFPLHANGSTEGQMSSTRFRYAYNIAPDGTPDLSTVQTRLTLAPLLAELRNDNREAAAKIAATIRGAKAAAVAAQLLDRTAATQTPAEFEENSTSTHLARLKPESANVGWGKPVFNRAPDRSILLEAGGRIFETGIYAHAPASHTYQLGGKWNSFTGHAGLASGHPGSVQFEVLGDGKSLWKSDVLSSGKTRSFEIPVTGIQRLELKTHPTADGAGADWGFWFEPMLNRGKR